MAAVLLLVAVICFVLQAFGVNLGTHPFELGWVGLAFFAASGLVGSLPPFRSP